MNLTLETDLKQAEMKIMSNLIARKITTMFIFMVKVIIIII